MKKLTNELAIELGYKSLRGMKSGITRTFGKGTLIDNRIEIKALLFLCGKRNKIDAYNKLFNELESLNQPLNGMNETVESTELVLATEGEYLLSDDKFINDFEKYHGKSFDDKVKSDASMGGFACMFTGQKPDKEKIMKKANMNILKEEVDESERFLEDAKGKKESFEYVMYVNDKLKKANSDMRLVCSMEVSYDMRVFANYYLIGADIFRRSSTFNNISDNDVRVYEDRIEFEVWNDEEHEKGVEVDDYKMLSIPLIREHEFDIRDCIIADDISTSKLNIVKKINKLGLSNKNNTKLCKSLDELIYKINDNFEVEVKERHLVTDTIDCTVENENLTTDIDHINLKQYMSIVDFHNKNIDNRRENLKEQIERDEKVKALAMKEARDILSNYKY